MNLRNLFVIFLIIFLGRSNGLANLVDQAIAPPSANVTISPNEQTQAQLKNFFKHATKQYLSHYNLRKTIKLKE